MYVYAYLYLSLSLYIYIYTYISLSISLSLYIYMYIPPVGRPEKSTVLLPHAEPDVRRRRRGRRDGPAGHGGQPNK